MELRLTGTVAIVTGSSAGIGRHIAQRLAEEGSRVVVVGLDQSRIENVVDGLRRLGAEALGVRADVGFAEQVAHILDATVESFGGVDILVNNAAWIGPRTHLLELHEDEWDRTLRTNLKGVFLCTRAAASLMAQQGRGGSIVSLTSLGGSRAHRMLAAYDACKGGVEALMRAVALDLAPIGVRANSVCPGWIESEGRDSRKEPAATERAHAIPLARYGLPSEVAAAVAFLSSSEASYITGQVITVDGGVKAQLRSPSEDVALPDVPRMDAVRGSTLG